MNRNSTFVFAILLVAFGALVAVIVGTMMLGSEKEEAPVVLPEVELDSDVSMTFVSGTEYKPDQDGQVIVEARYVLNGTSAVNSTNCVASVWYPDKSAFITNQIMNVSGNGNAFIEFLVPNVDGVFEYQSTCDINGKSITASKSFHVTKPRIRAVIPK